ncbi:MAG: hypothetical protein IPH06_13885 [Alphaproteobacteria bacterium]|nr:hypothetical protein [Alphaproteobacteria bacterium]
MNRNPTELSKRSIQKPDTTLLKSNLREPIPEIIEQKVSDIIANLRSALDQIACDLAILNRRGTSDVYFPTGESLAEFEAAADRKVKKLSPYAIALIHLLEPYKGGKGERFWLIGKLEAINKHKRLVAIGHIVNGVTFNIVVTGPFAIWDPTKWDAEDESLVLYGSGEGGKVDGDFKIAFDIAFGEIEILKGQPYCPILCATR